MSILVRSCQFGVVHVVAVVDHCHANLLYSSAEDGGSSNLSHCTDGDGQCSSRQKVHKSPQTIFFVFASLISESNAGCYLNFSYIIT